MNNRRSKFAVLPSAVSLAVTGALAGQSLPSLA